MKKLSVLTSVITTTVAVSGGLASLTSCSTSSLSSVNEVAVTKYCKISFKLPSDAPEGCVFEGNTTVKARTGKTFSTIVKPTVKKEAK